MSAPLVMPPDPRWSPLGRTAAYIVMLVVATLLLSIPLGVLLREVSGRSPNELLGGAGSESGVWMLAATLIWNLSMLLVTHFFLLLVDRVPWRALLPPLRWLREFVLGTALAVLFLGVLFLILAAAGCFEITGWGSAVGRKPEAALPLLLFASIGFLIQGGTEEIVCRGYLLRNLLAWRGLWPAIVGTSALFAIGHGVNPGATWAAFVNVLGTGVFLGLLVLRFSIWAAIGMHAAWNFVLAAGVAVPVSGINFPGIVQGSLSGPVLWTGGAFGPEASLVTTLLLAIGCVLLWVWPGRRAAMERARERLCGARAVPASGGTEAGRDLPLAYNYLRVPAPAGVPGDGRASPGGGDAPASPGAEEAAAAPREPGRES